MSDGKVIERGEVKTTSVQMVDESFGFYNRGLLTETELKKLLSDEIESAHKGLMEASRHPVTNLENRKRFEERLSNLIKSGNTDFSILLIDVDNFKEINDEKGHLYGDRILRLIAGLLSLGVRERNHENDQVFHWGGDEIAVLLHGIKNPEELSTVGNRLRGDIFKSLKQTISVGGSIYKSGWSVEDFFNRADKALYEAKTRGKNMVVVNQNV